MKTLKFKLKRKLSGKAIRKLERRHSQFKEVEMFSLASKTTVTYFEPRHKKVYFKNKPVGKKYGPTIYQLEDQHSNNTKSKVNYGDWFAFRFLEKAKNDRQKQRVYKLYPAHDPKEKRKREHERAVREWQEKLLLNHQNQVNGKEKRTSSSRV